MSGGETAKGALQDIRVLDFTSIIAGPFCTRLLADLGAEVIKIEPLDGDHMRRAQPVREGHSSYFGSLNCGKKSLALDLKQAAALDLARRLAAHADIVVENFRPGVMERLGLGYDRLKAIRPDIVYCSISGFGQDGPDAQKPAYAPIVHAAYGFDLATMAFQPGADRPGNCIVYVADVLAGALAAGAIQTALFHRARSGQGQRIDAALMDGMLSLLLPELQEAQFARETPRAVYGPIRARDGFVIVTPITQKNFEDLAGAVGREDWRRDERFMTAKARGGNWRTLMAELEEWTRERDAAEVERIILAAGCPCGRYRSLAAAMADAHLAHRGSLAAVTDAAGPFLAANTPFKLSATPAAARGWVAATGEHGAEILTSLLGLGPAELAALRAQGALGG